MLDVIHDDYRLTPTLPKPSVTTTPLKDRETDLPHNRESRELPLSLPHTPQTSAADLADHNMRMTDELTTPDAQQPGRAEQADLTSDQRREALKVSSRSHLSSRLLGRDASTALFATSSCDPWRRSPHPPSFEMRKPRDGYFHASQPVATSRWTTCHHLT